MSSYYLKELVSRHKDEIIRGMSDRMGTLPYLPYQEFILHSEERRRCLQIWVDPVIRTRSGSEKQFIADQDRVGYACAVQGFRFVSLVAYQTFQSSLWDVSKKFPFGEWQNTVLQ
jgi:hypothetical protein